MIQNSTILVIGSSRGLGKEISNLLIKNYKFKKLIVTSRKIESLNDLKFDDILKIKFVHLFENIETELVAILSHVCCIINKFIS